MKTSLKNLSKEIKNNVNDSLWNEFEIQFKENNVDFYDHLLKKFPDLTQNELKLCAYLRLNMSTKEISQLTGQSSDAIERARYRLRKKMDLTNSPNSLNTFLMQI